MDISMRSMLAVGVTAVTAGAIVCAPAIAPPQVPNAPTHRAGITLSAAVHPFVVQAASSANVAATASVDENAVGTLASGNAIMDFYFAAEPWVQWGFELATWGVGWVPVAGYFSGQVMVAYYTGEPVVQSFFQSTQYLVDGNVAAIPSTLVNGFIQGGTAFVQQELNWILGYFPPFPPLPPIPFSATSTLAAPAPTPELTSLTDLTEAAVAPIERVAHAATAAVDAVATALAAPAATVENAVDQLVPGVTTEAIEPVAEPATDVTAPDVTDSTVTSAAAPRVKVSALAKATPKALTSIADAADDDAPKADDTNKAAAKATTKASAKSGATAAKQTHKPAKSAHPDQGTE
jgi:hypothetical protein